MKRAYVKWLIAVMVIILLIGMVYTLEHQTINRLKNQTTKTKNSGNQTTSKAAITSNQNTQSSASMSSHVDSRQSQSSDDKMQSTKLWSTTKLTQLDNFIASWGVTMAQSYKRYYPENGAGEMNYYGVSYPRDLAKNNFAVDDHQVNMGLSQDGSGHYDYNIVAIYSDSADKNVAMNAHLYFFTIHEGRPVVLVTQQNQGMPDNLIHFKETANVDLKSEFQNLVNP
ncbi:DUF4767 domain-containing protein [Leuconostoc fallax]|uniref:DUF4767 domain-containing protein n=1 Tax=Leuconostoc fallax TaxID=1251 RepID=UPI002090FA2D|nr:DUF4767 domain-containing protein [Leuconostoc fallax]MCO6184186.1 DUF4767 domain-containing protein [Leuconostoc fallax]